MHQALKRLVRPNQDRTDYESDQGENLKSPVPVELGLNLPAYNESRLCRPDPEKMERYRCIAGNSPFYQVDAFRVLRTMVMEKAIERNLKTIMVTSPGAGEGKTVTAINLSLAFAGDFNRNILLADCDFRKQDVHKYLGISSRAGLVSYLREDRPLSEIIVWPGVNRLTLISGGEPARESSELLGSPRMAALLHEMKHRYDDRIVLLDAPPVSGRADALCLASMVDGILIVIEEGQTELADVARTVDLLPGEKIIGFAVNRKSR